MVCKAIAAALPKVPFLCSSSVRETRGYDREPVGEVFERARELAPCLLAFEDVAGLVGKHNRTVFLNELDGFASHEGILVIASSNYPGRIDEALLKRPSRFDRVFHLGMPTLEEREEHCRGLLSKDTLAGRLSADLDPDGLAERMAAESEGLTLAYLKEIFVSAALRRANERVTLMDDAFLDAALGAAGELRTHFGVSGTRTPSPRTW
jgi:SpoVK/Ycf46/Vps4 family AAA+-type ATPase